ncbi:MAG: 5-(carboxyamino)imidazole ribonucleotide synthase [Bacteroidota bacterium]
MQKNFYGPDFRLGIVGGGQLGRMFIQEAVNLNVSVEILDPDPNAPCRHIAHRFTNGSLTDFDTVYQFGKGLDVVTIEIENVNTEALERLAAEGVRVYPQPELIRMVQDKGVQKQFYRDHGIPTADFVLVDGKADLPAHRDRFPIMQKLRTGGYDGRGVTPLKDPDNLDTAFDAPSVLEDLVDLEKEVSVIVARSPSGEVQHFPLVELEYNPEANLVEFLFSPANVPAALEQEAYRIATSVIEAMGMVGLLAVELFINKAGEVLVNEIAPRPHNSGHHSIEANLTSQYAQHLRSILDPPLGATDIIQPAVMLNVLGAKGHQGDAIYEGLDDILGMPGVNVHLYGKKQTKPFRKMGHITVMDPDLEAAKQKAREVQQRLQVIA